MNDGYIKSGLSEVLYLSPLLELGLYTSLVLLGQDEKMAKLCPSSCWMLPYSQISTQGTYGTFDKFLNCTFSETRSRA